VAEFTENRAISLEQLQEACQQGTLASRLIRLEALLPDCCELIVQGREEAAVRHGRTFELAQALRPGRGTAASPSAMATVLKILTPDRRLIAVARHVDGAVYHPHLVVA
jgi:tRNA U55 pseudouridine synthase TruB